MEITQNYLKSILDYDHDTGAFTWIVNRGKARIGDKLGCIGDGGGGKKYLRTCLSGKEYKLHRLAWLYVHGENPKEIDHMNGDGTDNRIVNLRPANRFINNKNSRKRHDNLSGFTGVSWYGRLNKWQVCIGFNDKQIYLGLFDSLLDAVCARKNGERAYDYHPNHGSERPL